MPRRLRRRARALVLPLLAAPVLLPGCIVGEIDQRLGSIDSELAVVSPQLEPLPNLERLQTLGSITESLEQIDAHLAALRRTISSLDSAVPFLKFSDDEDKEATDAEGAADAEAGAEGGA